MDLPSTRLKSNPGIFAPMLASLFNKITEIGYVPESFKSSFLIPVLKKGRANRVDNYRGISLQSAIPKLFDKLITEKIYTIIASVICKEQHGFVKKKSTITNLALITSFINDQLNSGLSVDVIYLDI